MTDQEEHLQEEKKRKLNFFWIVFIVLLAINFVVYLVSGGATYGRVIVSLALAGISDLIRALFNREKPQLMTWIGLAAFLYLIVGVILSM